MSFTYKSILPCTTMHIYKLIKGIIENHRYQKILDAAYEQDQLIAKLSHTFGVQFRRDWVGRLYAVVNPAIKDGRFDNTQVFEYAQGGYDTTEHAKQWIVERTIMMENFIQTNNLFDALAFDVKRLDDNGNYLFVLMPVTLPVVLSNIKGSIYELLFGAVAAGAAFYLWPW